MTADPETARLAAEAAEAIRLAGQVTTDDALAAVRSVRPGATPEQVDDARAVFAAWCEQKLDAAVEKELRALLGSFDG